jgi:hypothetical protein
MVFKVNRPLKTFVVSCESICAYTDAMIMPFELLEANTLHVLAPGVAVDFAWVIAKESNYAEPY